MTYVTNWVSPLICVPCQVSIVSLVDEAMSRSQCRCYPIESSLLVVLGGQVLLGFFSSEVIRGRDVVCAVHCDCRSL